QSNISQFGREYDISYQVTWGHMWKSSVNFMKQIIYPLVPIQGGEFSTMSFSVSSGTQDSAQGNKMLMQ
ncbi:Hypothetical predicted protein, partial [Marmota monax]